VSALPPAFHNPCVVAMDDEEVAKLRERVESSNEEFETNCFCPADVSLAMRCLPPWDKSPGSPRFTNDYGNANS